MSSIQAVHHFLKDARAVTAVEYALIMALIAAAIIGSLRLMGTDITHLFSTIGGTL